MTTFSAESGYDMGKLSLAMLGRLEIVNSAKHYFSFTSSATDQDYFSCNGSGLKYKSGVPTSGTITDFFGYDLVKWGEPYEQRFAFYGFELKIADAVKVGRSKSKSDDLDVIKKIFSGKDDFFGSDGKDTFYGHDGDDWLWGKKGDDKLYGGDGDDTFVGDSGKDRLYGGKGSDVVDYSEATKGMTVNLADERKNTGNAKGDVYDSIERVRTGSGSDTLTGTKYANTLDGGAGRDTLWGGAGKDIFVFGGEISEKNADRIKDFSAKDDTFLLSRTAFFGLPGTDTTPPGERAKLPDWAFITDPAGKAEEANSYIVYNLKTGAVSLDSVGSDGSAGDIFAYVAPNLKLTAADFLISG